MAKYLVTGGAGFIGSHLCKHLLAASRSLRVLADLPTAHRHSIVNVCTGRATSVKQPARLLAGFSGHDDTEIVHRARRPGDARHSGGDPGIAIKTLGIRAEIALGDGLLSLLACRTPPQRGLDRLATSRPGQAERV